MNTIEKQIHDMNAILAIMQVSIHSMSNLLPQVLELVQKQLEHADTSVTMQDCADLAYCLTSLQNSKQKLHGILNNLATDVTTQKRE